MGLVDSFANSLGRNSDVVRELCSVHMPTYLVHMSMNPEHKGHMVGCIAVLRLKYWLVSLKLGDKRLHFMKHQLHGSFANLHIP